MQPLNNKNSKKPNSPNSTHTLILWSMVVLMAMLMFNLVQSNQKNKGVTEMPFSQFIEKVKNKEVETVTFENDELITGTLKPSQELPGKVQKFSTIGAKSDTYIQVMLENGITPNYKEAEKGSILGMLIMSILPMIVFALFFLWIMRRAQGGAGGGGPFSFAKPRIRLLNENQEKVNFSDVAGVDESKEELQEIVEFLKNPAKFTKLGGKLPKGALLVGPPGTGKTLLAKAVANEAGVPFLSISGSDFVEMFVGVGASRVRELFEQAKKQAPCIVFIDEIDAVGKARGGNAMGGGHDERDQTLNQLLVEMDGFDSQKGIIMLAATNRSDVLDPALLRPGRFDRQVIVSLPDLNGREKILAIHAKNTVLEQGIDLRKVAKVTAGFSGADLANLINEAALYAARKNKEAIGQDDMEEARDKVLMGPQRSSMLMTAEDKKITAYHEAGHAILSKLLKVDTIHKVTIIPRGMALGVTQTLPEDNQLSLSKEKALNMISMIMGGRLAEEIIFNHYTTGASNDIEKATELARRMVTEWGMSDLGPINFSNNKQQMSLYADFSEATRRDVDDQIKKIIEQCYNKAKDVLIKNKADLKKLSEVLLEKETLDGAEVEALLSNTHA